MKIKILYRYSNKTLDKVKLKTGDVIQVVERYPFGTLYRCTREFIFDHYGYAKQKEAKAEEIQNTVERISEEISHWEKLTKKKWRK